MNFKKTLTSLIFICFTILTFSCGGGKVDYNADNVALTKNFYNEYYKKFTDKQSSAEDMKAIENKYMTDVLVEELQLRTWEMEADAVLGVNDAAGMIKYLEVVKGEDDESVVATFTVPTGESDVAKNIYKFDIHFKTVEDKKLMDGYDFTWTEIQEDGTEGTSVYNTRYANKDVLNEDDKIAMSSIRKYYEDKYAEENVDESEG